MSSRNKPSNGVEVLILACAAVFFGFCFWIAEMSGASLTSVMKAAFGLIVLAVIVGSVLWLTKDYFIVGMTFYLTAAWFIVWPVLDSIAAGGHEGEDWPPMRYEDTLVNSEWVKWGVASTLIAVLLYAIYRRGRDSQYYWR